MDTRVPFVYRDWEQAVTQVPARPGCRAQYDQQWLLPNCICRLCTIHKSEAFSSAEAGEIPFGVCLCLSRPASALVAGGTLFSGEMLSV
jgi:hypothetical protein